MCVNAEVSGPVQESLISLELNTAMLVREEVRVYGIISSNSSFNEKTLCIPITSQAQPTSYGGHRRVIIFF